MWIPMWRRSTGAGLAWRLVAALALLLALLAGFATRPYHVSVPSFGEWGFVLAKLGPFEVPSRVPPGLRSLTPETLPAMFSFPADMARVPTPVNRLSNQVLVHTYEREWGKVHP